MMAPAVVLGTLPTPLSAGGLVAARGRLSHCGQYPPPIHWTSQPSASDPKGQRNRHCGSRGVGWSPPTRIPSASRVAGGQDVARSLVVRPVGTTGMVMVPVPGGWGRGAPSRQGRTRRPSARRWSGGSGPTRGRPTRPPSAPAARPPLRGERLAEGHLQGRVVG